MADSTPRFFFIIGVGRSGTTLLQRMLDAHPEIAVAPETHFMPRIWAHRDEFGELADDVNWDRLLDIAVELPPFAHRAPAATRFRELVVHGPRDYASLFRSIVVALTWDEEAYLLGEKTPIHLRYVEEISRMFSDARFVHIVRDPRAVVNSLRSVPWSAGSASLDAHSWTSAIRAMRSLPSDLQSSIFTLRYEDLLQGTEETLAAICAFLGAPFASQMLTYYCAPFEDYDLEEQPWKNNAQKPPQPAVIDRWRHELPEADVRTVEAVAWRQMHLFGYRRTHAIAQLVPWILKDVALFDARRLAHRLRKWGRSLTSQGPAV